MNKMSEEIKISQLQEANEISANDLMMIIQNGVNKKKNIKQMAKELNPVAVSATQPTTNEKVWFKTGKNKFNSSNLSSQTNTGITTSFDGSTMKLNGTSTGDGSIYNRTSTSIVLEAGTYTWTLTKKSGTVTKTTQQAAAYLRKSIAGTTLATNSLSNFATSDTQKTTSTLTEETMIEFSSYVNSAGIVFNNLILEVQIEKGTGTAYEAYIEPAIYTKNDNGVYEEFRSKKSVSETDISVNKTSYVTAVTRAKIVSYDRVHFINIACTVSQSGVTIFNTSLKPSFLIELNLVTNNNTTARCVLNTNGNIEIAKISSSSEVIYVNGIVII